jgi:hypothetical protein
MKNLTRKNDVRAGDGPKAGPPFFQAVLLRPMTRRLRLS